MKNIAHILAIYILTLSVMPCNDVHSLAIESSNTEMELQSHEEDHEHHMDFCSPFCACDCCQTVAETTSQVQTQIESFVFNDAKTPCFHNEKESISSFWRPPIV